VLKDLPAGQRRAIAIGSWLVPGGVTIKRLFDLQPMPASKALHEVSGVVAGIEQQGQRGRSGSPRQRYVSLRDHAVPYRLDDSHAGNWNRSTGIRNGLHRGERPTPLVEDCKAHGPRIWEIRRGREALRGYLTVSDVEWKGRLMLVQTDGALPGADRRRGHRSAAPAVTRIGWLTVWRRIPPFRRKSAGGMSCA
jgi:hypothetical protein